MKSFLTPASLIVTAIVTATLSGCIIVDSDDFRDGDSRRWRDREEANKRAISELNIGKSLSAVVNQMGQPEISEAFKRDDQTVRVYYYRTQQVHSDSRTTKDECSALVFVNDELIGWGEAALRGVSP